MNIQIIVNKEKIVTTLCLLLLFLLSWAPFVPGNPLSFSNRILPSFLIWLLAGIAFLIGKKRHLYNSLELVAFISILIFRFFNIFYAYNYKGLGLTDIYIGLLFCCQTDMIRAHVFKYFKYILVVMSVLGIICYISFFSSIGLPYTIAQDYSRLGAYVDFKICYLALESDFMLRFCGSFDEPGWFGTWAAFFLCADNLNFRKRENILLVIGGLLTFSIAFIILLVIYFIIKNLSNWKRWLWVVLAATFFIFVLPNVETGNLAVDHVLQRMVITDKGLTGDNRHGVLFERIWKQTIQTDRIYWGYGAGYSHVHGTAKGQGVASIKQYIVNFGIFGTFIIFMPILIASVIRSIRLKNKIMLFYVLITFISLYQRPVLFEAPHFIVFLCGLSYIGVNYKEIDLQRGYVASNNCLIGGEENEYQVFNNHSSI